MTETEGGVELLQPLLNCGRVETKRYNKLTTSLITFAEEHGLSGAYIYRCPDVFILAYLFSFASAAVFSVSFKPRASEFADFVWNRRSCPCMRRVRG